MSIAVEMPWYQLWLLDVVAVLLAGLFTIMAAMYYLARFCSQLLINVCSHSNVRTKKKE